MIIKLIGIVMLSMLILVSCSAYGNFVLGSDSGAEMWNGLIALGEYTANDPLNALAWIGGFLVVIVLLVALLVALNGFRQGLEDTWNGVNRDD